MVHNAVNRGIIRDTMSDRLATIRTRLQEHDQAHVLRFIDECTPQQRDALIDQIESVNLTELGPLIDAFVRRPQPPSIPEHLEPAPYYPHVASAEQSGAYDAAVYRAAGEDLVARGKVAAFTVAGGQGTRLGWNGPKGTFPATPVTGKPLFRILAEQILAVERRFGATIPWYIMTSPINDADTRAFFLDNNCFGLRRNNIFMFPQGVMPSLDKDTGAMLLAQKHELALNPDGHGGSIKALRQSGAIEDMVGRGIEHISYTQIDNPLAKIIDPLFIGLHVTAPDSSGEMSSKMVPKAYPEEKVGVFCRTDGKTVVIEYSDLPEELARQRDDDGNLRFIAGSIAIHLFGVSFVERLTADPDQFGLPFHRAEKKVPHIDLESGKRIEPDEPNAVKLESFVFDALPLAEKSIVYETTRQEEFAPIKNADGVDSPATSHQIQSNRNAAWLEPHGVKVPRNKDGDVDAQIEISPLTALEPSDLAQIDVPSAIQPGDAVVL